VQTPIAFLNLSTGFSAKHEKFFLEMTAKKLTNQLWLDDEEILPGFWYYYPSKILQIAFLSFFSSSFTNNFQWMKPR